MLDAWCASSHARQAAGVAKYLGFNACGFRRRLLRRERAQVAQRLAESHTEMKILFLSGYTDDAVVRHGILQEGTKS